MDKVLNEEYINNHLINNDSLFNYIYVINQHFDILPNNDHYGVAIEFQDLEELRSDFLNELYDTIIDWVYNSEKYIELKEKAIKKGKSEGAANSEIKRKAIDKFRATKESEDILVQGQFGELLLFHFIQKFMKAIPLLRKMKITTSKKHERFGADAIHIKIEDNKNIIYLGEAKTYTSKYKFNEAFNDAIKSILSTYRYFRSELGLYVHEDFLDKELNDIAEQFLDNTLNAVEMRLVCLIVYNETNKLKMNNEKEIKLQIKEIIENKFSSFDKNKIDINKNIILKRITYIVFPIWKLDELVTQFQNLI